MWMSSTGDYFTPPPQTDPWNFDQNLALFTKHSPICRKKPEEENRLGLRYKLFEFLHRPSGLIPVLYHSLLITIIFTSNLILNTMKNPNKPPRYISQMYSIKSYFTMNVLDLLLVVTLISELSLRLWCSEFRKRYRGLWGKLAYLNDYWLSRILDFFAILTFSSFVIFNIVHHLFPQLNHQVQFTTRLFSLNILFRILLLFQITQVYRVLLDLLKPFRLTFQSQFQQLMIALFGIILVMTITSFLVYLIERYYEQSEVKTIFTSFWLSFETFSTIGYGDVVPFSFDAKSLLALASLFGVTAFILPQYIIGNGLSIVYRDERRINFKFLSTAAMIGSVVLHQKTQSRQSKSTPQATKLENKSDDAKIWNRLFLINQTRKLKSMRRKSSHSHVMRHMEATDRNQATNDNTNLWYHVGQLEESVEEISSLLTNRIVHEANEIGELIKQIQQ